MKISAKDWRIIDALDRNVRATLSEIAEHANVSKQVASYRLSRMLYDGIIEPQVMLNLPSLGMLNYSLLIKLTGVENIEDVLGALMASSKVSDLVYCDGYYEVAIDLAVDGADRLAGYDALVNLVGSNHKSILSYDFLLPLSTTMFNRKWLVKKPEFPKVRGHITGSPGPFVPDDIDMRIVAALCKNARAPLVDIARDAKINVKTTRQRLLRLFKNKVIFGFVRLGYEKLGYHYYRLLLNIGNATKDDISRLEAFGLQHKKILHMSKLLGPWQVELGMETESDKEYYDILYEIRKAFGNIIKNSITLKILRELKVNPGGNALLEERL